ncbi:hypothetical protein PTKIN_Ptkin17bG0032800 [Pterospermum kingtungense]
MKERRGYATEKNQIIITVTCGIKDCYKDLAKIGEGCRNERSNKSFPRGIEGCEALKNGRWVPSVQELATQPLETVPKRYIRDDIDIAANTNQHPSDPSIVVPLIDLSKLLINYHDPEL